MSQTNSDRERIDHPSRLSQILEKVLKSKGWHTRVKEYRVFDIWDEVVGVHTAKNTSPSSIDRGVLFVTTRTSSWSQELTMMKNRIIERLNKRLGEQLVHDIKFVQGTLLERHHGQDNRTTIKESEIDDEKLIEYTGNISDEGLRKIINRILRKALS